MSSIVVALISGLCVAVPSVIATLSSSKSNNKLILYRIDQLESKVNLHNQLIDRMYKVEKRLDVLDEKIEEIKKGE